MIVWVSGEPFIFPSLGPSAFILAFERCGVRTRAYRVVGSHLIGGIAGLLTYPALAAGISFTTTPPPVSIDGLRLAGSGVVSIILTTWGMITTDTIHAPACATTLIVSLGLLSTPLRVAIIVGSVIILAGFHQMILRLFKRFVGDTHPRYSAE
jgi:hypothetical protein